MRPPVGVDRLNAVAGDLETLDLGALMDLDAAPCRLCGITPSDRIVTRGSPVGMPKAADDFERAAIVHVEERNDLLDALLVDHFNRVPDACPSRRACENCVASLPCGRA